MTTVTDLLNQNGLEECVSALVTRGGLTDIRDLQGVSDADLMQLGVDKLFHRKKIMRLANGNAGGPMSVNVNNQGLSSCGSGAPPLVPGTGAIATGDGSASRLEGGDHVRVEVVGARGTKKAFTERDYYVKVSLCDIVDGNLFPVEGGVQKTGMARGPLPVWSTPEQKPVLKVHTTFRTHCIAFELKESRLIGENKMIGMRYFPISAFHKYTADMCCDTWFPLSESLENDGEITADIRLRLSVPGGCPRGLSAAFHVKGVVMNERKLRVTVFNATIKTQADTQPADLPNTYVTVNLEGVDSRPKNSTSEKAGSAQLQTKSRTAVVTKSMKPSFDEAFEYFAEASRTKLVTVKLKKESGAVFTSHDLIGQVRIPIQFYLAQKNPSEIDEVFPALNEAGEPMAQIHIRLEVLARDVFEKAPQFKRTDSIKREKSLLASAADHPALSPQGKQFHPSSNHSSRTASECGEIARVSDDDLTDDDMFSAAASMNQRRVSGSSAA